jgi:xanthine dehydrogenase accessory factor
MQAFGTDQEILQTASNWLQQQHEVLLVTVLKTWGSSPRPAGSMMILRTGSVYGSVSGGCVEEDLLDRYQSQQLGEQFPLRIDYGVNRDDAHRFGLPCGGRLELLIERLYDHSQLQKLLDMLQQQQLVTRQVDLQNGQVSLQPAEVEPAFIYTNIYVRKVFGPQWTMLLIGAGHLSQYVSRMALMLDYRVVVCDPREEYAREWSVPGTELISMMPDDAVHAHAQQPRSVVVALTHDPKLDDMALLDALASPAFYIGAIGSQRNCDARRERLMQLGVTARQLQRLHAPVGLPIGSHTPPEIAVSILAEITRERNMAVSVMPRSISVV